MSHSQRIVEVCETGIGKYQNKISIGKHALLASEPTSLGGDDSGPTPIELLNAALGACISITLRMYADRKNWPLDQVIVTVTHKRGQLEECSKQDQQNENSVQDIFTKEIKLIGKLDEAQTQRLMQIADKCPVHRILKQNTCTRSHLIV